MQVYDVYILQSELDNKFCKGYTKNLFHKDLTG